MKILGLASTGRMALPTAAFAPACAAEAGSDGGEGIAITPVGMASVRLLNLWQLRASAKILNVMI